MRDSTQHLLQRLSLWVLGQALPDTGALKAPARLAVTGVVAAAAAGTLISLGVVAGLIGLYLYLVQEGLSVGGSLALVSLLGLMVGLVVYFAATRTAEKIPEQFDELKLFHGHGKDVIGDTFNLLVSNFMQGMAEKPIQKSTAKVKKTRAEIEDTIKDLIEQLDGMQADLDAKVKDTEAEVVLEMQTPRRRKPH